MADRKLDLLDDLLSSKTLDQHRSIKDEGWGGSNEEKSLMGLVDESKDQVASDSNIPLSPQWLYAKPVDPKTSTTGAFGEMRAPVSLALGNTSDTTLKDTWRLDGSQDRKDRRKTVADIESGRRWREEERETGLLGRRDRRKEDRRADVISREISENRTLSSADRWHDPSSRSLGHESRRDSKWSSRWGPEDKEKDSRTEKRADAEKEDTQIDRQSFVSGNRAASERDNDSRDKWRPRHRMEVHAGGPAAYRSAPGFGLERGRVESSNVRFAPGRGRSTLNGSLQIGRPSSVPVIGSVPVDKLSGSSAVYCYPRGKLLDIYRKQKTLQSFDSIPDGMDHVTPIAQVSAIEPLAFVPPEAEEEAVLADIWRGKVRSSEVLQNSFRDKNVASNTTGCGDMTFNEGKQSSSVFTEETVESPKKTSVNNYSQERDASKEGKGKCLKGTIDLVKHDGSMSSVLGGGDICSAGQITGPTNSVDDLNFFENQQVEDLILLKHPKMENVESAASFEDGSQLPDDSSSLFDFSSLPQTTNSDQHHQKSNDEAHSSDIVLPPEDLSLFYLDPQGVIQGPYMGIDIITWFEQGYFGTDLPVRLSDMPAGSPFQELGELMPHLKIKCASPTSSNLVATSQLSDAVGHSLEESVGSPTSGLDQMGSVVVNDLSTGFETTSSTNFQSRVPNHGHLHELQSFQNSIGRDEEIVFPGRPGSSNANHLRRSAGDTHSSFSSPASHHSLVNEFSEASMARLQDDDKLHPFGLLMSELRDSSHLRRTQSSNMASNMGDQGQFMDSLLERDATFINQSSLGTMGDQPTLGDMWSDDYRRNTLSKPNTYQGSIDAHQLFHWKQELNGFDMAEHLISQKLQKEQLRPQNHPSPQPFSHATGLGMEQIPGLALSQGKNPILQQSIHHPVTDVEQLLELKFQQQRHLELQQQRHLELQQQQWLELQHQRKFELQRQRQLEIQQQQHRFLQQQQQQQQVRLSQMKLMQQQQQEQQQLLLEQLLQHQMPDLGYGQLKMDPMRENLFDQLQMRMNLLHELQQNSHARHLDPSLEQIIQAKIGQSARQGQQADLLEFISQAKHGNMLSSEQQLHFQQEQMRARQLSMMQRQQSGLDGERRITGPWSVDEVGQFARDSSGHHQAHSAGFGASDLYQQQQRLSSHEEKFNHLNWNHALQERHQRGSYEASTVAMDRSTSLPPAVATEMNLDNINTRAQGVDFLDGRLYMHPTGQLGSSAIHPHSQQVSDEFYASPPDMTESHSGNNVPLENSWIKKQMQQLNLTSERQRKGPEVSMKSVESGMWTSIAGDEDKSQQALMDDLHHNLGLQAVQLSDVDHQHSLSSPKNRETFWPVSEKQSSNRPFDLLTNQEVDAKSTFIEGPQNSNSSAQFKHLGNTERLILRSNSGAPIEESLLLGSMENSGSVGKSALDEELLELEGLKGKSHGSKGVSRSVSEIKDNLVEQAENSLDRGELPINTYGRHGSQGGNGGLYNYEIGLDKSVGEVPDDRLPSILQRGLDSNLNKRPPVSKTSSQDVLPEPTSAPLVKQKSSSTLASDEGKRESFTNPVATRGPENQASGKKDLRFRMASSGGDAPVSETSFIDMLKKPVLSEADASNGAALESSDGGTATGRSGKKKGKKGRQIDPALLGFKVSSNRIMMGEIHRLED